jgi:hypothetical protein
MSGVSESRYGPALLPQHAALLANSGIHPAIAHKRRYRSVIATGDLRPLGFAAFQRRVPALLIPIADVTGKIVTYQLRPDEPRVVDGKIVKYEFPRGSRMVLDVPAWVRGRMSDPSVPLFITEGSRKADAAVSKGLCCIALLGVWNFRGTNEHGGKTALGDWESISLNGRTVYICFDSDAMHKEPVHQALVRLRAFLVSRGADVWLIYLPPSETGAKVGLDDFLAAGSSKEALLALATKKLSTPPIASERLLPEQIAALCQAAQPVVSVPDPLKVVEGALRSLGYGGDLTPALIVYLAATSRLLAMRPGAMPVHLLLVSVPSAGKSYTLQTVLSLLPREAWHSIDAGSPRVLIYDRSDLRHRVIVFSEADSLPAGEDNPAASAIRNLLQDHHLRYSVVVRDLGEKGFRTQEIDKPGPSVLITTSTRSLGDQLMTRLFALEIPEDIGRIRDALLAQADIELSGIKEPDPSIIAFQGYLQTQAPWHVVVPFVRQLNDAISRSLVAPRILRDAARLRSLIKAIAILRHAHRKRDDQGRLLAELDDYRTVYALVGDLYEGSTTGASRPIREAVEAVIELRRRTRGSLISVTQVAKHLNISKVAASRRIQVALKHGWLINSEDRRGYSFQLEPGEHLPERTGLPHPDTLQGE